ncbi:MAG: CBS domain-containing protein [Actinobacteria bacterium]|nr:CBS domain-containing protein [Actinomycetota bacterium]
MRARDLATHQTSIPPSENFARAVQLVAEHGPLLVIDEHRGLLGVVSNETLLRGLLPAYLQAHNLLAGVLDDESAATLFARARERKVEELLGVGDVPLVDAEDSLIEVASVMVRASSPLVAVQDQGKIIGGIALTNLLTQLAR